MDCTWSYCKCHHFPQQPKEQLLRKLKETAVHITSECSQSLTIVKEHQGLKMGRSKNV